MELVLRDLDGGCCCRGVVDEVGTGGGARFGGLFLLGAAVLLPPPMAFRLGGILDFGSTSELPVSETVGLWVSSTSKLLRFLAEVLTVGWRAPAVAWFCTSVGVGVREVDLRLGPGVSSETGSELETTEFDSSASMPLFSSPAALSSM